MASNNKVILSLCVAMNLKCDGAAGRQCKFHAHASPLVAYKLLVLLITIIIHSIFAYCCFEKCFMAN